MAFVNPPSWAPSVSQSKFFQTQLVQQNLDVAFSEEDSDWWVSVQQCGARVALAAALLVSAQTVAAQSVSPWQDELPNVPQEEYWQNQVAAVPGTLGRLYLPDPEELPASSLSGTSNHDEYFWNPNNPLVWSFGKLYLPDPEEIPAAALSGASNHDEYWQNPNQPLVWLFGRVYLPDPEEIPAGNLSATVDEYFWTNSVPLPVPWSYPSPAWDANDFIGYTLDEDFWQNPATPVLIWLVPSPSFDAAEIVPQPIFFQPDEDFWVFAGFPVLQAVNWQQPLNIDESYPGLVAPLPIDPCKANPMPLPNAMVEFAVGNPGLRLIHISDGNTVLVRSDYALWCCKCGMFVPKSEVAVDVVGYPEGFKGVF